jgi:hypothetical protein
MKAKAQGPVFYVYEHWRPDTDVCFWVGKGHANRAYDFRRNFHYNNVVRKLSRLGMCVEVRMVQSGMPEIAALALEIERIAFWRAAGIKLTNYTAGGEGITGLKHSDETRLKIKEKRKNQKIIHSDETRRKIARSNSQAKKGRPNPAHGDRMRGRKHSAEHKVAISIGLKARNYSPSTKTRALIGAASIGKKASAETKAKLRASHLGKKHSLETRQKMSTAHQSAWDDDMRLAASIRMKVRLEDHEFCTKLAAAKNAAMQTSEYRLKQSAATKAVWAKRKKEASLADD